MRQLITTEGVHQWVKLKEDRADLDSVLALLRLDVILQRVQQTLDPLTGWLPSSFLATFDPCNLGGQEKCSESPRICSVAPIANSGRVGFTLLQQPQTLLTQSDKAIQLSGVDVLADVQRCFKWVLNVQRGYLRLVLLFALDGGERENAGRWTNIVEQQQQAQDQLYMYSLQYIARCMVRLLYWSCFQLLVAVSGALRRD